MSVEQRARTPEKPPQVSHVHVSPERRAEARKEPSQPFETKLTPEERADLAVTESYPSFNFPEDYADNGFGTHGDDAFSPGKNWYD